MKKAEDVYDCFVKKDVELKEFDDSCQNVMYGVDFQIC